MKLMIRSSIEKHCVALLILLSYTNLCAALPSVDTEIASYLKKKKFQLELFEIAMCRDEILAILETDTLFRKHWKERTANIFDIRLNEANLFYRGFEAHLISNFFDSSADLKTSYPLAFEVIENSIRPINKLKEPIDYPTVFLAYIEYPEDVDPPV